MKQSPDGRPWRRRQTGVSPRPRVPPHWTFGLTGFCAYLLVEDHVHAMLPNVLRKLAQEVEDVFDVGRVRQPSQPQAVPHSTRRGQERD